MTYNCFFKDVNVKLISNDHNLDDCYFDDRINLNECIDYYNLMIDLIEFKIRIDLIESNLCSKYFIFEEPIIEKYTNISILII